MFTQTITFISCKLTENYTKFNEDMKIALGKKRNKT